MEDRYLIAIASYRRPSGLKRLLDSLVVATENFRADVVVVDNDPSESARWAATSHVLKPMYVVEPEPGIASARNRALEHFADHYTAIVFVDDDEWVSPDWLEKLTLPIRQANADAVQGTVISVFPESTPEWVCRGGFIQRPIRPSGQRLRCASTNTTLLRRDTWVNAGSPRFDPSFSVTGGSDTEFFWGIRKSGATIVACANAIVYEEVPPNRLSLKWIRRRATRDGIALTRVRAKHNDSLVAPLVAAVFRSMYSAVVLGVALARGQGLQAKPYCTIYKTYGRFAALFNHRIYEYARTPARDDG